jgi:hypothetical protein
MMPLHADYVVAYPEWMVQKVAYDRYRELADDASFIFMVAKHDKSHFP